MTILYGSGISNSTRHSGDDLPLLVVGGGAGTLPSGRHLVYPEKPTIADLLVTFMDKLGVPVERIGGSTGRLPLETLSPSLDGINRAKCALGLRGSHWWHPLY